MVNNSLFKLSDIPLFNPVTQHYERIAFWGEQKRYCIEGHWQCGKWIPGPLYYYINFHHIELQDKKTLGQKLGLPLLRDIDWELFLLYEECRGFSGFELDTIHTCDRKYGPDSKLAIELGYLTEEDIKSKKYVSARDYLRRLHTSNLGKPLYQNPARHFISIQSRGGGKSFASSGIAAHNYLFDGAIDYDEYLIAKKAKNPLTSDTIIGAIDTKYTEPLIKKVFTSFEQLPGSTEYLDTFYPSPLFKSFSGSLHSNKREITSNTTKSLLRHRTFSDNPLAANGTRPNLVILDEVGFMNNLYETWGAIEATQASQTYKRLVIWALGTGGLVSGRAAVYAETMFRNPEQFDCLSFPDLYENRGTIGYFVPYTHTLNEFKEGVNLITNEEKAKKAIDARRSKKKKSKDQTAYITEIINGPLIPSEAFLTMEGTFFPTLLLKEQKAEVVGGKYKIFTEASYKGWLKFNDNDILEFSTIQDIMPIRDYPLSKEIDKGGCIEIWQMPIPQEHTSIGNLYIAGADVVDKAVATTSSLPSIIVMNRITRQIVAEYTGRTEDPSFFYEVARRLALFYNAKVMYEQNLVGMFTHFEKHKSLHYLADTPYQLRNREVWLEDSNTSKGIVASERVNSTGREFIKSWLLSPLSKNNPDELHLHTIYSEAILSELISWNKDGNFDRVSALIMLMWFDETIQKEASETKTNVKTFLEHDYFKQFMTDTKSISTFVSN